jgi:hypothetical protein
MVQTRELNIYKLFQLALTEINPVTVFPPFSISRVIMRDHYVYLSYTQLDIVLLEIFVCNLY